MLSVPVLSLHGSIANVDCFQRTAPTEAISFIVRVPVARSHSMAKKKVAKKKVAKKKVAKKKGHA
ncbi:MAG: hypothetical protein EBZ13_03975 [Planctomycetia bacterium]|nr:hypothetical protein [Planctomycetia bacterium]